MIEYDKKGRPKRGWNDELYKTKVHFYKEGRSGTRCGALRSIYKELTIDKDHAKVTCERCLRLLINDDKETVSGAV